MTDFASRLRSLRREAGLSQAYLAEHIGISVQSVSNWECANTMPDISQIVPLAALLSVSTDYLLGVGTDEARDKAELAAETDRIWATYSVNTPDANADLLAAEAYRRHLTRYPLDYAVKYKRALALTDYLTVSLERRKFDIPPEKAASLAAESTRLLTSVCENSPDTALRIDAKRAYVSFLLLQNRYADAQTEAAKLPETCGIRADAQALAARRSGDIAKAREYSQTACKLKLTDYTSASFYRARSLADDPTADKAAVLAAWEEMQIAARRLIALYADPADLAVNAYEKNPYCYLITSYTACANFLLDRDDTPAAVACAKNAAEAAADMVKWAKANTSDPLVLADVLFFADHTPHWCSRWTTPDKREAFLRNADYQKIAADLSAVLQS